MRLDDDLKYFESQEFKDCLNTYESALSAGSPVYMDADDLTDVAEYYSMVMHDDDKASEAIAFALKLHPDAVNPQIFMARQAMQRGDVDVSREICDAIENQEHREVVFLRAELWVRDAEVAKALAYLQAKAAEIEEDQDFFIYDAAYIFIDYHQFEAASTLADQLEEIAPDWYKTWEVKADALLGLERFQEAKTYIDRMLDVDPFCLDAWNWSAEAYCGLMDFEEAMNSLEYALAIDPENERALQLKAWTLLQQGNVDEAHRLYQQEIERAPENELNWLYDSYCLLSLDMIDKASTAIEKAEELADGMSAEQAAIYEQHANILSKQHQLERAIKYIDQSEWEGIADLEAWEYELQRAHIYAENDQPEDAIASVARALEKAAADDHSEVYHRAGLSFLDTGYYDAAAQLLENVLDSSSDEQERADVHAEIAYCCLLAQKKEDALEHLLASKDLAAQRLRELFGTIYPNVSPLDYYDYLYHDIYGKWPHES